MAGDSGISKELETILSKFAAEEKEIVNDCVMAAGKQAKREVVARSPGDGTYRSGWTVRNKRSKGTIETVVYNAKYPSLTHLLEKSHVIRNAYGQYGRSKPQPHIGEAQEAAEAFLLEQLKAKL